jgi:hypothetical protein
MLLLDRAADTRMMRDRRGRDRNIVFDRHVTARVTRLCFATTAGPHAGDSVLFAPGRIVASMQPRCSLVPRASRRCLMRLSGMRVLRNDP